MGMGDERITSIILSDLEVCEREHDAGFPDVRTRQENHSPSPGVR
jgi:hypothetical protein